MLVINSKSNAEGNVRVTVTLMKNSKASTSNSKNLAKKAKIEVIEDDMTTFVPEELPWKNQSYALKSEQKRKKWKNSKQILDSVKSTAHPNYLSIEAAPSVKPQNKYCDITGLPAPYVDPRTNVRYHSSAVFQYVREIPASTVQSYLLLRNAGVILK